MIGLSDALGVVGGALMLGSYAAVTAGKLDPHKAPALLANFAGAGLVLVSLIYSFNLASFLLEAAWAVIALAGLVRLLVRR